jgi:hypothetical protein
VGVQLPPRARHFPRSDGYSPSPRPAFANGTPTPVAFTACPDRHRHQTSSISSGDNADLATTHHLIHLDGSRSVALTH